MADQTAPSETSTPVPSPPPTAAQRPEIWHRPTGDVADPWAWLRDRDDPATIDYLEGENAYAAAWFAPLDELRATIFSEIKSRVQEDDTTVPARKGTWWYTSKTAEGSSYPIHCRGDSVETAESNIVFDENIAASGHDYSELGAFDVSPSQDLLIWSQDVDGGERYDMRIRDLSTGLDRDDILEDTYYGTAWSADGTWMFYTRPDEQVRPYQIWRHRLGAPQSEDVLVLEENDERYNLGVELTRSGEWIVLTSESRITTEISLIPANEPASPPSIVRPRTEGVDYSVDHWGDRFVILTNADGALDFAVHTAPIESPDEWSSWVAHTPGTRIVSVEPFADFVVLHEWAAGQPRLRIIDRAGAARVIDNGDEPSDVELDSNPDYQQSVVRFSYQSLTTPRSIYEYDVATGQRSLLKQTPVPGVDLGAYSSRREWATSTDGTQVPVDLVWRTGTPIDGSAPAVLYGYGSYEASSPPWFSVARLSLLDRGWIFALGHPRGGGELGRQWYEDGKLLNKRHTFEDFIACGEHLLANGYSAAGRLAIRGGSAGGLLVGACMTLRPDLFRSVVAEVPFVDVVTTMSDPSLPLTITEWEEWGDPRTEPYASYMLSYSPYDNVVATDYPAVYVTGGLNDPRVAFHEPAKWVAKLRATATGSLPLILKTEMGAGHGGPSGRYDAWKDEAQTLSFLIATT